MRLVFVHGWALGPEIWDALALSLASPQVRVDLGYFGAPDIPEPQAGDILVGHSAGLLWGLSARSDWAGVVAINSFARFCFDAEGRGCVKPAALRAMRQALDREPQNCADDFRRRIGIAPASRPAQKERLMQGLDMLRDFEATSGRECPWLVLGAEDDFLATAEAARNLARLDAAKLVLRQSGGHGLPWTAADFCVTHMAEFLGAHEF